MIQYFYEGMLLMNRSMVDVASGVDLVVKTSVGARNLIANVAKNSQQFGSKVIIGTRRVGEIAYAIY